MFNCYVNIRAYLYNYPDIDIFTFSFGFVSFKHDNLYRAKQLFKNDFPLYSYNQDFIYKVYFLNDLSNCIYFYSFNGFYYDYDIFKLSDSGDLFKSKLVSSLQTLID